ncbi:bestrophin-1 domain protein [Ancylostoma caninum]|uniref:Bestrophin homolog n=1 Tax=Ancylostoma caninum TaxID=29170 RepID=A0A368H9U7_ANCCA|nr:bestrophin-1 domain protein [Ancylostoma caninum]
MLGFFVTIIVGRWNQYFNNIGWVDNAALVIATYLRGNDEKSRMMRRNVLRYMVLTQVLILRDISMQVRVRLPSLDTIVAAGFMTEAERDKYNIYFNKLREINCTPHFLPIQWCYTILFEARASGKLSCDLMLNEIVKHIGDFRRGLAQLANFDWVPIPLVYPQVVFLAVRSYFFLCLIARQSVLIHGEPPKDENMLFPMVPFVMTAMQYIFLVGWMKVAESLMNPLGEDDDDFECNYLIDRNLRVGLTIVDECYGELPLQQKDSFWGAEAIEPLYSAESAVKAVNPQIGSAANYEVEQDEVLMMPHIAGEDYDNLSFDDPEARLLPRGISVVSVNRHGGSRSSIASRRGVFDAIRKQFSRNDVRKISRPTRLNMSQMSLNNDAKPSIEIGSSSLDILNDLADEAGRNSRLVTPDGDLSPTTPPRRSPVPETLTTVPEEDEESQRTRNSVDLRRWKEEAKNDQEGRL